MGSLKDHYYGDRLYPGFKARGTSESAAAAIAPRSQTLRDQCFLAIKEAGAYGLTPDEVAAKLDKSVLAIRPRISELAKQEQIRARPDITRKNASGIKAKVYVV